jgi:hypothetical protein
VFHIHNLALRDVDQGKCSLGWEYQQKKEEKERKGVKEKVGK